MSLFETHLNSILHSGGRSDWLIDCDALSDGSVSTLAWLIAGRFVFREAIGVPRGGLRLAQELNRYATAAGGILIVDDVLTTGASMEGIRKDFGGDPQGVVIFARGACPDWVTPVFAMPGEWS